MRFYFDNDVHAKLVLPSNAVTRDRVLALHAAGRLDVHVSLANVEETLQVPDAAARHERMELLRSLARGRILVDHGVTTISWLNAGSQRPAFLPTDRSSFVWQNAAQQPGNILARIAAYKRAEVDAAAKNLDSLLALPELVKFTVERTGNMLVDIACETARLAKAWAPDAKSIREFLHPLTDKLRRFSDSQVRRLRDHPWFHILVCHALWPTVQAKLSNKQNLAPFGNHKYDRLHLIQASTAHYFVTDDADLLTFVRAARRGSRPRVASLAELPRLLRGVFIDLA